jgi:hypothetical protein
LRERPNQTRKEVVVKRLLAMAATMLLAFLFFSPVVFAADPTLPHNGRVLISTGGDVSILAGEHADAVIVVNGTASIAGEVNTVFVVDGAAVLTGARTESVIAVRSPVTVGAGSVVLGDVMKLDSVVTRVGDGAIGGSVRDMAADLAGIGWFVGPALVMAYLGFALAAIAAGLLLAGLAARQVRAAEALISHQPVQTLVAAFAGIFLPIILVTMLFVTIVGAPLAVAILLGLWPLAAFLGYLVAGIWIGDWVLERTSPGMIRERPYLAAVVGILILEVLGLLPFLPMIASLFGFGAVLLLAWRTLRAGSLPAPAIRQPAAAPLAS